MIIKYYFYIVTIYMHIIWTYWYFLVLKFFYYHLFTYFYTFRSKLIISIKGLFSYSKARLFGTLNRSDIKIRISIFFTCNRGGKLGFCKTKEWEMVRPFFLSYSFFPLSLPPLSFLDRGSSAISWFSQSRNGIHPVSPG